MHHRRLHNFSTFFKRFKYGAKDKGTIRDIKPLLKQNPSSNDIESILSLKLFEPIDIGRNMDTDSSTKTKLMDAGLVFDKLLLEANKATLPPVLTLRNILEETTVPDLESEELTLSDLSINEEENDDSIHGDSECVSLLLDDNILSEFDCLGQLITLQSPPPRSEFRPKLSSMQHASKFYHSKADFKEFITRLYSDFENVVVFETARESSTGQCRGNEERSRHNDPSTVKFSTAVHVNRVETREEYDRCDRNFLRNRDLLLNSTEFLDSIKWEINEFKRCEMVVHRDSVQYTQLFL